MTVSDFINRIENLPEYIAHSLILKAADNYVCIYKYLIRQGTNSATRVEIFIELNELESELELLEKIVVNSTEVSPAK